MKTALKDRFLTATPRQKKYLLGLEFLAIVVEEITKGKYERKLASEGLKVQSVADASDICVKIAAEEFVVIAQEAADSFKSGENPIEAARKAAKRLMNDDAEEILLGKLWGKGEEI